MEECRIGSRAVASELHVGHHGAKVRCAAVDDLDSNTLLLQEVSREIAAVPLCATMPPDAADHATRSCRIRASASTIASAAEADAGDRVEFAIRASWFADDAMRPSWPRTLARSAARGFAACSFRGAGKSAAANVARLAKVVGPTPRAQAASRIVSCSQGLRRNDRTEVALRDFDRDMVSVSDVRVRSALGGWVPQGGLALPWPVRAVQPPAAGFLRKG